MTEIEFKKIVETENIKFFNWYDENNLHENELGIKIMNKKWIVYATSERAAIEESSIMEFDNESDALEHFLGRLRSDKRLRDRGYF